MLLMVISLAPGVSFTITDFPIYFPPFGIPIRRLDKRLLLDTLDTAVIVQVRVVLSTSTHTDIPTSRDFARVSSISRRISGIFHDISRVGVPVETVCHTLVSIRVIVPSTGAVIRSFE